MKKKSYLLFVFIDAYLRSFVFHVFYFSFNQQFYCVTSSAFGLKITSTTSAFERKVLTKFCT